MISEMDSNSLFEHLINDTIWERQGTLDRFLGVCWGGHGRQSMSTWAVPWGFPVLAFVRPEPDVSENSEGVQEDI